MPETKLKDLHMATCIEDLDTKYNIPNIREKKIKVICNSAKKLYDEAEVERKKGDEEMSYIHYMKYVELLTHIKGIPGYEKEKKYVSDMIGSEMPIQALEWASKLKTSLISRYKEQDNRKLNNEAEKIRQKINSDIAKAKDLKNEKNIITPKAKSLNSENVNMISDNINRNDEEMTIKSTKLYNLLKDKYAKILILDTRKSSDYEESHISFMQCINIPEECIVAGFTANKLEKSLPALSKYLWSQRATMDYIVLLDWSSTSLIPGKSLHLLKTILLKWDPHVIYKNAPIVLDGGFEDWLLTYPSYVTNPRVIPPSSQSDFDDLLNEIEYPTLIDPALPSENNASFDRSMKSNIDNNFYSDSIHKGINPNVDRSSKAAALHTYEERSRTMKNILEKQEKLAGVSLNIEKRRVLAEQNWEQLRMNNEEESDNQLETNQLREQELISEIMQLENVQRDMALENQQLRDQLEEYRKREEMIKASEISPISDGTEPSSGNSSPTDNNLVIDEMNEQMERNLAAEALIKENKIKIMEEERAALERQREMMQADREKILADAREKKKLLFQKEFETEKENASPDKESSSFEINNSSVAANNTKNSESKSNVDVPQFDRTTKPLQNTTTYVENIQNKYRDFQGVWGNQGRGLTGLKNLGNTCYMNSIIQCLNNTSYLVKYFCDGLYRKHINVGPRNDKDNKTHGAIAEEIAAVVKALWSGQYRFISPKDLRNIVGRYKSMFRGVEQQDSHEFLTILMDWLHDDLQISVNQQMHSDRLAPADKAWLDYTKSKESLILKLFYGQIKSTVKCLICGKESVTYDTFSNLSLELPRNANKCSLSDCLELYLSDENIIGWNCPLCKEKRNAVKKLDISKLPPVLVIHFKRFYVDQDYNSNTYRKKQTYIDFPLKNLDMNYYSLPLQQNKQNTTYNLYGVSNHYGSMESGHYTAFCKSNFYSKWFKFDDHSVTEISSSDVVSSAAYILFYTTDSALQQ